mgnify:FL=1
MDAISNEQNAFYQIIEYDHIYSRFMAKDDDVSEEIENKP